MSEGSVRLPVSSVAGRTQLDAEQENWKRLMGAVAMILRTVE